MRNTDIPDVDKYGAHMLSNSNNTPDGRFRYLVALLLSSQTRDPVTAAAMCRLDQHLPIKTYSEEYANSTVTRMDEILEHNLTIRNVRESDVDALKMLIKPVGFYNKKAEYLKKIADTIDDVPNTIKGLTNLPGIGLKMANICLQVCYNSVQGIAIDTHMQRICQKLGWGGKEDISANPNQVAKDLEEWVPKEYWADLNPLIVGFGQVWCSALHPKCTDCLIYDNCLWSEKAEFRKKKPVVK
ncbi:Endonuclease_III [Hexamita inflata]|uniref:Endonuclease III n=1 Tax=Hexamita inflata TaxID=28002 RepID=A0AA86TTH3_9EUKA|nr:Endonuclease III [Hexamita inflata]